MYHPADNADAEYVELTNISDHATILYNDSVNQAWRFTDNPDNPGIDLTFPINPSIQLAAGERLLLVRNSFAFNSTYTVPANAQILEWTGGRLSNAGEKIQLSRPDDLGNGGQPVWVRVDRVNYSDGAHHDQFDAGIDPWPAQADGDGDSLQKIDPALYGNDPANWIAALPTPGL